MATKAAPAVITLNRAAETDCSTWGSLVDQTGAFMCNILERGTRNPDHVRIPAGTYKIGRRKIGESHFDTSFKKLLAPNYKGILWLPVVPGRGNIMIHPANWMSELLGCLAPGSVVMRDSNKDFCVGESGKALQKIYPVISALVDTPGGVNLVINDPLPPLVA